MVAWSDRVNARIDRVAIPTVKSDGASLLYQCAKKLCAELRDNLDAAKKSLSHRPKQGISFEGIQTSLFPCERILQILESWVHPVLASRSAQDVYCDKIIALLLKTVITRKSTLLNKAGHPIRLLPVVSHRLSLESAAEVLVPDMGQLRVNESGASEGRGIELRRPQIVVFFFYPSIWSLTTITLAYHEIGHVLWRHASDAWRSKLTALIRTAFPAAFARLGPPDRLDTSDLGDRLVREIAADCAAGLIAGYTYASTLCGFLITKPWANLLDRPYLNRCDRCELVLSASAYASPKCELRNDSYVMFAWNAIDRSRSRSEISRRNLKVFIDAFASWLRESGISLADSVKCFRLNRVSATSPPPFSGMGPRELLTYAAAFRDRCTHDDGDQYATWEREVMRRLRKCVEEA